METSIKAKPPPPYDHAGGKGQHFSACGSLHGRQRWMRPRRTLKFIAFSCLACLVFVSFAQWRQMTASIGKLGIHLSRSKLDEDWQTCSKLRRKPQDPIGPGRQMNARFVDGHKPTLIRNATIWVGEPEDGTSAEDAHNGKGYSWVRGDVFVEYGLIREVRLDSTILLGSLPQDTQVWDARGRQLTSGIIDMHSHAGVDALPELDGNEDSNELSGDTTPFVRSIDALNPLDPQIQVIKSGGVTTSLVLPGSGNNIGGEAFVFKHAVGQSDGRPEVSAQDMLADPERNWRYMKMACGENPKRVYGEIARGPFSRMGESWEFRHAFEQAADLVQKQNDWCERATKFGVQSMDQYLPQDLKWESLGAVLRGQVHVNTHCYTIPDLEAFIDHTNEFEFPLRAFHHAHQTFLVPEILKRAWGGRPPASALFADNMYYKAESYVGSEYAGKILHDNGLTAVYVSDNPVLNAQHVVFEAAKAYRYGLPYHAALASVTSAPADLLGLGQRLGKVKAGFDADLVLWDSDPLSVGATPVQVWIDGYAQFMDPVQLKKPVTEPMWPKEGPVTASDHTSRETTKARNIVFSGVSKVLLASQEIDAMSSGSPSNVIVTDGKISCIGLCHEEIGSASSHELVQLVDGHVTDSFTAFGAQLGLNAIDAESVTDNGPNPASFSRGIDGLALDTKKLRVAHEYGVTRAISAPKLTEGFTHRGTSVGFRTDARHSLESDAVWSDDVAVHYTLTLDARQGDTSSFSGALATLRKLLMDAVSIDEKDAGPFSERTYLHKVVTGLMPLVITVHSADTIAAVLRLKSDVEEASTSVYGDKTNIRLIILGGAEAYLLASELAAENVGVVLAPFQSYGSSWDQRRGLTGAPLTNGTSVDALVDAGVITAIGLEEDWLIRDMALLAGIAHKNSGGRLSEKEALGLISTNIDRILGTGGRQSSNDGHFVVYEGSPLEIDGSIRAVGSGGDSVTLFP